MLRHICCAALVLAVVPSSRALEAAARAEEPSAIAINDNRTPAGAVEKGVLVLKLRADESLWRPEGEAGPAVKVQAFGEVGRPLQIPSPLVRVPEGTEIAATIQNDLDALLRVHGLCARDGTPCAPLEVPAHASRELRFRSGRAGTYHYWATATGMPLPFRAVGDTQLSGAFVVDSASRPHEPDRVLVITDWTSLTLAQLQAIANAVDPGGAFLALNPQFTFLINGLSWPSTERLMYRLGEEVRWRVINLSTQPHPMHLHGFFFDVRSLGDGVRDTLFDEGDQRRVVTQLLTSGATMSIVWRPERAGNWIFHCHNAQHIAPERRLTASASTSAGHHHAEGAIGGMAGMILGVTVVDPAAASAHAVESPNRAARKLTMWIQNEPGRYGSAPAYGFAIPEGEETPPDKVSIPGPTVVLRRGEPVEITLVNKLKEPTAIHWHGMELESYYDGVHGWSGVGNHVTPLIGPGGTFIVRFTPPRAGTFMYHTHMHDDHQLSSGMYGPMLVLDPEERYDPDADHVLVISRAGPGSKAGTLINGSAEPAFTWKSGTRHRLRFINITPDDIFVVTLNTAAGPVTWCPTMKDGAPLPLDQLESRPAIQTIAVGETYDFEYQSPEGRQSLWMEVRTPAGRWHVQGRVTIK